MKYPCTKTSPKRREGNWCDRALLLCRSKMPLVVDRSLGLSEKLRKYGPSREIEVHEVIITSQCHGES